MRLSQHNDLIVVVGMHRSGTSAITRGLATLGCVLGDTLIEAIPGVNDKGFWEDVDVNTFNQQLLQQHGSDWYRCALFPPEYFQAASLRKWRQEARGLLARKLLQGQPLALKEPRLTVLLPFWQQVFAELGLQVGYVHVVRHPMEVAQSLLVRDGFSLSRSLLLWWFYNFAALRHTQQHARVVVHYGDFLEAPSSQLARIANVFQFVWDPSAPESIHYLEEFLDPTLRHAQLADEALSEVAPDAVTRLYRALCALSRDEEIGGANLAELAAFGSETRLHQALIEELESQFAEQAKLLNQYQRRVAELESQFAEQAKLLNQYQRRVAELESQFAEQAKLLNQYQRRVAELEPQFAEQAKLLNQYQRRVAELEPQFAEQAKLLSQYQQQVAELETQQRALSERLDHQEQKSRQEREILQHTLDNVVAHRDGLQRELTAVLGTKSWRWTRPLRAGRLRLRALRHGTQQAVFSLLRLVWRRNPLSMETHAQAQIVSSNGLSSDTSSMETHAQVQIVSSNGLSGDTSSMETHAQVQAQIRFPECLERVTQGAEPVPVPYRKVPMAMPRPVRMIAFHLPQYHEIPENNQWWGKGFTEWTNVKPTQPLFPGHYQPHVPLQGYYDLTDPSVLPRQAELARRYGIEGFCFYFYWFRGHRLLEQPLELLLAHSEWEIPFCLCWANENWTRRWDGLDQEVLISQDYSEADDQAFIGYLERYLRDPRYIRINGRPLLLIYRPDLLPDAAATVERWRGHSRCAGIGEIFVAYTQSFEQRDPRHYGMDAAIEFPPNNMGPPELDPRELGCREDFAGKLHDWSFFPERAAHYAMPDYPLFRGLNSGWDNTPRRKNQATILVGSDPLAYQQWAVRACEDTIRRMPDPQERMIFINAWNEWGEGAHLEPDVRHGCAYLEATDMAQIRAAVRARQLPRKSSRAAIVIHAYYPEVLQEMLPYLEEISPDKADLWITTTEERSTLVRNLLSGLALRMSIRVNPNRGRDVLPFLMLLPELLTADYGYVLKLHTKKSLHRVDGDAWRRAFYETLLNPQNMQHSRARMEQDLTLGMLAPKGYIVPMELFWGSNARQASLLAKRMGITFQELNALRFVAGTMFFCRWEVLLPIWALQLQAEDFEEECGQVDGTLAHAVERAFGMACFAAGSRIENAYQTPP